MRLSFVRKILIFLVILITGIPATLAASVEVSDLFFSEQTYLQQVHAPEAWKTTTGSSRVIVAILDAGFDLDHEDLQGQYWMNRSEIAGNNKDDDANRYEDDVQGWDFVDGDPDPSPDTTEPARDSIISHGTLLAGIIGAATDNGIGIAGINHHVAIMPLRVLDKNGSGSSVRVREAIRYAVENGAEVINLSFTFKVSDDRLRETIKWAFDQGVTIVAAVGNDDIDTDRTSVFPACYDKQDGANRVIGVAALGPDNKKASFSNFGKLCTDLAAPGTNIFGATYNDVSRLLFSTAYGGPWEGTSVAAPIVTGAVALLKSAYPSLTPDQIRNVLKLSVNPVAERSVEARLRLGAGTLNIARALEMAASFAGVRGRASLDMQRPSSQTLVVAKGPGTKPLVQRVDGQGQVVASFLAYHEAFRGGVRLAMGDVTGDGVEDIITVPGRGGGPQVRVFDLNGKVVNQFFAFETEDRKGLAIATGDLNNDSVEELVVTRNEGATGQVRIFNRSGQLQGAFYPFGRTTSAIAIAVANVDEDPEAELLTAMVTDKGPVVRVYDGNGRYVRDITIQQKITSQLFVAAGDLNGDGVNEIIVSSGAGNTPIISVYDLDGKERSSFFAYDQRLRTGVSIQVGDRDQNGRSEIYTAPGVGGGPQVRVFDETGVIGGFFVGDALLRSGVQIGL